jgi:hypothetical protein
MVLNQNISPLVYKNSKREKWNVKKALSGGGWISKIDMTAYLSMEHIHQFNTLWVQLRGINLIDDVPDEISWDLTEDGQYSSKFSYKAQFLGATSSPTSSSF